MEYQVRSFCLVRLGRGGGLRVLWGGGGGSRRGSRPSSRGFSRSGGSSTGAHCFEGAVVLREGPIAGQGRGVVKLAVHFHRGGCAYFFRRELEVQGKFALFVGSGHIGASPLPGYIAICVHGE